MTLALPRLSLLTSQSSLRGLEAGLKLALEFVQQQIAWNEHLLCGGDPNEQRRDRWVTRDDVKARYRKPKAIK